MSITHSECVSVGLGIQHAPYCLLWPVLFYNIFPYYLVCGMIFEKKNVNITCVFGVSLQPCTKYFLLNEGMNE
jgi:hypothetical protein